MAVPARLCLAAALWLAATASSVACSSAYIPNTDVVDTEDNRRIIAFCEQYRKAVEARRVGELLKLASADYYDNGGNVDASDDIDRAGLEAYLTGKFNDASELRYEIRYRRVSDGDDGVVLVDYTYSASYRLKKPDGAETWRTTVQDNRLELVPEADGYLVLSGM